ncbi:MAG: 23S rRNA (uracil(1939)-C(5))-methyltransferase RlmD [Acidobacteria bacterium]|uniref:23S rRNA (Uracil(1939)-C(5))-methyltransferase RlmD n=1 Tax=Candidatus Polarisedimenticola svalbardensis TaxID=2886004 RepID=A0A8J7CCL1_9BACT|nr:23S rRNA (uracil(1939)-C(5))-methyltransferase RlmD [Candidatus Polarisedimenticola svalbardensis]
MSETTTIRTCPHQDDCGACAMLGVGYSEQLSHKRELLGRELSAYPSLKEARLLDTLPSPQGAGYRNRARMAFGTSRQGGTRLGYFRAGTREIVDAPECGVLVPELLETTRRLRKFLATARYVPRELRHLDLRCGSDPKRQHLILVFRATAMPRFPLEALQKVAPAVDGISMNLNPGGGPQVIRGSIKHLWGRREIWVRHAGVKLRVSPGAFFQVNLPILPAIHGLMDDFLAGGEQLMDLYAGVGTHGLALGRKYRKLVFGEGTRAAVADLKSTVRSMGRDHVDVFPAAVERSLRKLSQLKPDAVVLNPSRAGALEPVLAMVGASAAKQVAYLSCEPATLCRDLDHLARHGYQTVSVQPIDMMPQTGQIEALALLRSAPRKS